MRAALWASFDVFLGAACLAALLFISWYGPRKKKRHAWHLTQGIQLTEQEEWQAAVFEFDAALAIYRHCLQSLFGRGLSLTVLGDAAGALESIDLAVKLGLRDETTLKMRCHALMALEHYERAVSAFDELLLLQPECSEHLVGRGFVHLKLRHFDEAIKDATTAIKIDGQHAVAYNNRGLTYLELGRHEESITDLRRAIQLDANFENPRKHLQRAEAEANSNRASTCEASF